MSWDPFTHLGLPRRFDLDRVAIERAYLARAAAVHPDLARGDSPADAEGSVDPAAASLNRARQELSDPELRASVLLGLLGGPGKESDRSLPDGFLMEVMDVRERMESDKAGGDRDAMARWEEWAGVQRTEHIKAVADLFATVDMRAPEAAKLKAIRTRLNAWRYIERMLEQIG